MTKQTMKTKTMAIDKDTAKKLDNYKVHPNQSYAEVIKKILDGEEGYEIHMDKLPPVAVNGGDAQNTTKEASKPNQAESPYIQNGDTK